MYTCTTSNSEYGGKWLSLNSQSLYKQSIPPISSVITDSKNVSRKREIVPIDMNAFPLLKVCASVGKHCRISK